jgi:hypothetical protein
VRPVYGEQSYTWELKRLIERQSVKGTQLFDFCFIDGAHTWDTDGLAFFLVDKLLRPGGWILFDDLDWRLSDNPVEMENPWIKSLPEDLKNAPQIGNVFELLVCQHPGYTDFRVDGRWGWARKSAESSSGTNATADVLDHIYGRPTIRHDAYVLARRAAGRLLHRTH